MVVLQPGWSHGDEGEVVSGKVHVLVLCGVFVWLVLLP